MLEHREDPTKAVTEYNGKEPQPRPCNNTELFVLGIILIWLAGMIAERL